MTSNRMSSLRCRRGLPTECALVVVAVAGLVAVVATTLPPEPWQSKYNASKQNIEEKVTPIAKSLCESQRD